jgi:RecJ-like exonuclease
MSIPICFACASITDTTATGALRGDGRCHSCRGTGKVAFDAVCGKCDGTGLCSKCSGTGSRPPTPLHVESRSETR